LQKEVKNDRPKSENNLYLPTAGTGLRVAEKIKACGRIALRGSQAQRMMVIGHPERSGWLMVVRHDPGTILDNGKERLSSTKQAVRQNSIRGRNAKVRAL
jgi:hypothetical protein